MFEELDNEHRRGLGFAAMRQVEVTATDAVAKTATVILGGDVDNPIDGVRPLPGYVPLAGDVAWCWQNGSDLMLVGGPGLELPKVKVRKGATSAVPSGDTTVYIDFTAAATVYYDRYDMFDPAQPDRIIFRWPGKYLVTYRGRWTESEGGRRIAEIEDSGGAIRDSDRMEWDTTDTSPKDITSRPSYEHVYDAGDWVRVKVFQSSGGPLSIQDEAWSNVIEASYLP